jgi:hypothetical protein
METILQLKRVLNSRLVVSALVRPSDKDFQQSFGTQSCNLSQMVTSELLEEPSRSGQQGLRIECTARHLRKSMVAKWDD